VRGLLLMRHDCLAGCRRRQFFASLTPWKGELFGTFKIGQAVSIGIVYAVLDFAGFDVKAGPANGADALLGVSLIYAAVPSLMAASAALLMFGYPLTAVRHTEIRAQLAHRREPGPMRAAAGAEIRTASAR